MFMVLGAPPGSHIQNLTFTNNIVSSPSGLAITGTGANAPCGFQGNTARERLASCVAPLDFEANVIIGTNDAWPKGNLTPRNPKEIKFLDHQDGNGVNYRLSPQSPHKRRSTDGKDVGADIDAVTKLTAGVRGANTATPEVK
jgi:hypothetical protein